MMKYKSLVEHPEWEKLEELCAKIELLKQETKALRRKIDNEVE